jgi:hypothetical protein
MEKLFVDNKQPQKNNNQQSSIIEYPYLTYLYLVNAHDD